MHGTNFTAGKAVKRHIPINFQLDGRPLSFAKLVVNMILRQIFIERHAAGDGTIVRRLNPYYGFLSLPLNDVVLGSG